MSEENIDQIRNQFSKQAQAYADTEQAQDEKSMAALVGISGAKPTDHTLDVACGPGVLTRAFAQHCTHATGCDVTQALLDIARTEAAKRNIANVEFQQGNATSLPFEDNKFDIVSCRAAFHHFVSPFDVLMEMKRVAKPGGTVFVADFLSSEDPSKSERHNEMERLCDPSHTRALTLSEYKDLISVAGLELNKCIESEMHYELEEWLAHGGPDDAASNRIRQIALDDMGRDELGLNIRKEQGKLHFTHQVAIFRATKI